MELTSVVCTCCFCLTWRGAGPTKPSKNRLTKAGDKSFTKTFTKTRKQYVDNPLRARECCSLLGLIAALSGFTNLCCAVLHTDQE